MVRLLGEGNDMTSAAWVTGQVAGQCTKVTGYMVFTLVFRWRLNKVFISIHYIDGLSLHCVNHDWNQQGNWQPSGPLLFYFTLAAF